MTVIYVDESGDLGWAFNAPYRQGGSSRYLTIAATLISNEMKHHPKRLIKSLYKRLKTPADHEIKWAYLQTADRLWFAEEISALKKKLGQDLILMSMTVQKEKVLPYIRSDSNKLYNYMMNLLLVKEMAKHPVVSLIPDQRSVKVSSGHSMHDYLQTQLWFDLNAATQLKTTPLDSSKCAGLQFSDMLAGMVQSHFEDRKSECIHRLSGHVKMHRLYF
jgi:hypothetical protein